MPAAGEILRDTLPHSESPSLSNGFGFGFAADRPFRRSPSGIDDGSLWRKACVVDPNLLVSSMRLALYQPDIPQNTGAVLRLAACLGVGVDIIEPCGFLLDDRRMRRAGMDYLHAVDWRRHPGWDAFRAKLGSGDANERLILLTTGAEIFHHRFAFSADDVLLLGRETAGVPPEVHAAADARIRVPMRPGLRSLNQATAAALVLGEALRQTGGFPDGGAGGERE